MNKLAIVYWSGTGNTETMANCIADGARESGAEVAMLSPGEFSATRFSEFGVVAFGCPAMGAEQLEEDEVEPMFAGLEGSLGGKKIALFGSYGWGGQSIQQVYDALTQCKAQPLLPPVRQAYRPTEKDLEKIAGDVIQALEAQQ